ncbi:MAG TPA: hypothetical protein VLK36_05000 [Gaiellaceae bacterium]|nr:hypothetical protein [Gaiellaceae bacterium]
MDVLAAIVEEARDESPLWGRSVLPDAERDAEAVFSSLAPPAFALGIETTYEAYLMHYGRPRLFVARDDDEAILLGDYLYAHGLVRIAKAGGVPAVAVMAELISTCAALRASGGDGDGDAWVAATRDLGGAPAASDVERALAQHSGRVAA